jgi:hypothetical protein
MDTGFRNKLNCKYIMAIQNAQTEVSWQSDISKYKTEVTPDKLVPGEVYRVYTEDRWETQNRLLRYHKTIDTHNPDFKFACVTLPKYTTDVEAFQMCGSGQVILPKKKSIRYNY